MQSIERAAAPLAVAVGQAQTYADSALSPATRDAYRRDWAAFTAWCADASVAPLPATPATVATYLAHRSAGGAKPSTIARALSAIAVAHRTAGEPSPRDSAAVRSVVQGIRRTHGVAPSQVAPLLLEDLDRVLGVCGDGSPVGCRNRALLLLGWMGALRRSELVALDVTDLTWEPEGVRIHVRRSKTDQEGQGRHIGIPYAGDPSRCAVRALQAWLQHVPVAGPVFVRLDRGADRATRLGDRTVANIIKGLAEKAGLDPTRFSGHSLRSGFVTAAARAGRSEAAIMRQTGHQSVNVMRRYLRPATVWQGNAASGLL
jgi:integrase